MSVETWLSNSFQATFKENREKKIERERKRAKKKSKDAAAMQ